MKTIAFVFLAMMACASAAPHYHHHRHHQSYHHDDDSSLERFIESQVFDTRKFWEELRKEMMGLDIMIADLCKRFPTNLSDEKVEGNEYKIRISLSGFHEKEIIVKARKGLVIVQAVHNVEGEPERNYLDLRTLPEIVDVNGSWTYENGVLVITFPLARKNQGEPVGTEVPVTQAPEHSREVVENDKTGFDDRDVDVGVVRGDQGKENSISSNEIPQGQQSVEATTYAVDLKGDVELLPVNYKTF